MLVVQLDEPPVSLLPQIMRHVKSIEYYGNPNLIQQLPKFGDLAIAYVGDLREIRARVISEVDLDYTARTIPIYNSIFYVSTLDKVIDQLSRGATTKD